MIYDAHSLEKSSLELLPWDSSHFGFAVVRMNATSADVNSVRQALYQARRDGVTLVYWQIDPGSSPPQDLLAEYAGALVDRKAVYRIELSTTVEEPERIENQSPFSIRPYRRGSASVSLQALALAAGVCSRFRVDSRVPKEKWEGLYTTWIERSTQGELADIVLTVADERQEEPVGMVTATLEKTVATIGLIAVAEQARGRGLGRRLIRAAHHWMIARGVGSAVVTTQAANIPACRLYERCGYQLQKVCPYYHFWPMEAEVPLS